MPAPIRAGVRLAALAMLRASVPQVAKRVYSARAWPVQVGAETPSLPALLVYAFRERKSPTGNLGPPSFDTTLTLAVMVRAAGKRETDVETQLDDICGAVEACLLEDGEFVRSFSSIGAYETTIDIRTDADLIVGEAAISVDLTWSEDFQPRLETMLAGLDVRIDAIDPADLLGAYAVPAPWPPAEAPPRTFGPDGRAEWELPINLPQA